jgi:hypothetical protein
MAGPCRRWKTGRRAIVGALLTCGLDSSHARGCVTTCWCARPGKGDPAIGNL